MKISTAAWPSRPQVKGACFAATIAFDKPLIIQGSHAGSCDPLRQNGLAILLNKELMKLINLLRFKVLRLLAVAGLGKEITGPKSENALVLLVLCCRNRLFLTEAATALSGPATETQITIGNGLEIL